MVHFIYLGQVQKRKEMEWVSLPLNASHTLNQTDENVAVLEFYKITK